MFTGMNAIDFAKAFPDNAACFEYLASIKWKNGYACRRCGCKKYNKRRTAFHRRCRHCDYDESPMANTLFHDMRIPIRKAFIMIFRIVTKIKAMSTMELAREAGVQQKTAWLLKRKVQAAMRRHKGAMFSEILMATENVQVQTGKASGKTSRKAGRRTPKQLRASRHKTVNNMVRYKPSKEPGKAKKTRTAIAFVNFLGGKHPKWQYPGTMNQKLLFRNWLRGIHHKCSEALFHCYCDEFAYRFDYRHQRNNIFNHLISDMLLAKPQPYALLKIRRA